MGITWSETSANGTATGTCAGTGSGQVTRSCDAGGTWNDDFAIAAGGGACGMPFFSYWSQVEDCIVLDGEENRREMSARNLTAGDVDTLGRPGTLGVRRCFRVGYARIAIQMRRASNTLLESSVFPRNSRGTCLVGKAREFESDSRALLTSFGSQFWRPLTGITSSPELFFPHSRALFSAQKLFYSVIQRRHL